MSRKRAGHEQAKMADVARLAGVSLATASRALGGVPGVAKATRERVLAAAADLDYVASPQASALARGAGSGRVGVVLPDVRSWYYYEVLAALEEVFSAADLETVLYCVHGEAHRGDFFETLPARRKVDGLVIVSFPLRDRHRDRIDLLGVPVVVAGEPDASYPCVFVDDVEVARQAVQYLARLGHRRIGYLGTWDIEGEHWASDTERRNGYRATLADLGLTWDPGLEEGGPLGMKSGTDGMSQLLTSAQPPTAVFAFSDEIAVGALRALHRAGLDVPRQFSVIGVDDHPIAQMFDLTTMRQPVAEIGKRAAERLLADMHGGSPRPDSAGGNENRLRLPTRLVLRGTTGIAGRALMGRA